LQTDTDNRQAQAALRSFLISLIIGFVLAYLVDDHWYDGVHVNSLTLSSNSLSRDFPMTKYSYYVRMAFNSVSSNFSRSIHDFGFRSTPKN